MGTYELGHELGRALNGELVSLFRVGRGAGAGGGLAGDLLFGIHRKARVVIGEVMLKRPDVGVNT